jgi:hypothetical protein
VLKNIHHVFINQQGNLVFNKHELVLTQSGHLQLLSAERESRGIAASAQYDSVQNEFVFPGGNKIKVHRSGMLILVPADTEELSASVTVRRDRLTAVGAEAGVVTPDVSRPIYIPAALDASLAAATDMLFSGNMYYYPKDAKQPLVKVSVPGFYEQKIRPFIQHILQCS